MKHRIATALIATLIASTATAGKITEEVDRFKGTKTVAWQSFSDPGRGYSFNVYAFYSKPNDPKPYGYYTLLVPPYGTESFSGCSDNYWLVDDKPAPELKAIFESMGSSQTFRSTPSRSVLENLAAAKKSNSRYAIPNHRSARRTLRGSSNYWTRPVSLKSQPFRSPPPSGLFYAR